MADCAIVRPILAPNDNQRARAAVTALTPRKRQARNKNRHKGLIPSKFALDVARTSHSRSTTAEESRTTGEILISSSQQKRTPNASRFRMIMRAFVGIKAKLLMVAFLPLWLTVARKVKLPAVFLVLAYD